MNGTRQSSEGPAAKDCVLVTGVEGMIGYAVAQRQRGAGTAVVGMDQVIRDARDLSIPLQAAPLDDIHALNGALVGHGCTAIIHRGAISGPMLARDEPERLFRTNFTGTLTVMEAARRLRLRRVVFGEVEHIAPARATVLPDPRGSARMADPKLTVCLTFDVDGMSAWIGSLKSNNPSMISRGEFTVVATPRVLDLLREHEIPGTFCVPGHTVCAFPDLIKAIRDGGHEIGHHGWVHENPADFDRAGEERVLSRGLEALQRIGVTPAGYRSPAWCFSANTIDLLQQFGFLYDSSCMGSDFHPYYLRKGDRWSLDEPYRFGETTDLVELPVTWGLDDFPVFEHIAGGINAGNNAPSAVEEIWSQDFEFALNRCPGGVYILTMHPEFIGRGHRLLMLERLIRRFKGCEGVRFSTLGDYARNWKAWNPLSEWADKNPLRTGVNSFSSLP